MPPQRRFVSLPRPFVTCRRSLARRVVPGAAIRSCAYLEFLVRGLSPSLERGLLTIAPGTGM